MSFLAVARSARCYSTLVKPQSEVTEALAYVSHSKDPWFNLAFEDWLFRTSSKPSHVLFLYRNTPSVIIGRNQNPWNEMDLKTMKSLDIPFIRRRSGGGTVFHDLGNTNYSVMMPQSVFNRRDNAQLVASALNKLDVPASVNERHDIVVDGYKISGSAFKLTSSRAYHHGTMLLNSNIKTLSQALKNPNQSLVTKGVPSVRSPVKNVVDWQPNITHETFVDAIIKRFKEHHKMGKNTVVSNIDESLLEKDVSEQVTKLKDELQEWSWHYGQTPEFTNTVDTTIEGQKYVAEIKSKHGRITELSVSNCPEELIGQFSEKKYGFIRLEDIKTRNKLEESIVEWLIECM
ncbi:Lipoyltransferase and lipoate-protein ligase [Wallemia mellicola]|nr:Lipoyltransferase and lipoate-protein ligase [Wallemia mellicola]TIC06948.1 Lipoyltransferase and lipoate-protein ligase [Wallemia mellicola]TIC23179.1 Lipoyltransferase and lipoate-protein ligase [Wallemia mellicola]TIC47851.1 Lipoyltransferase and lipoate-protein ligase [Wallemia mellicola]